MTSITKSVSVVSTTTPISGPTTRCSEMKEKQIENIISTGLYVALIVDCNTNHTPFVVSFHTRGGAP